MKRRKHKDEIDIAMRVLRSLITTVCWIARKLLLRMDREQLQQLAFDLRHAGSANYRETGPDQHFCCMMIGLVLQWGEMGVDAELRGQPLSHAEKKAGQAYALFCMRAHDFLMAAQTETDPTAADIGALKAFAKKTLPHGILGVPKKARKSDALSLVNSQSKRLRNTLNCTATPVALIHGFDQTMANIVGELTKTAKSTEEKASEARREKSHAIEPGHCS